MLRVLVDLDGICTNMPQAFIDTLNLETREPGDELSVEDLTDDDYERVVPNGELLFQLMRRPGWWLDLPVIPGAVDSLYALHSLGADVVICTSAGSFPRAAMSTSG